jgi:hypothetical protein
MFLHLFLFLLEINYDNLSLYFNFDCITNID